MPARCWSRFYRRRLICQYRSFSNGSVVASGNELYTHFIPHPPDFGRSQSTANGLFEPNPTLRDPHKTRLITRRSQVQILPPLLKGPAKRGPSFTG